jgi:hypothetical protein
MSMDPYWTQADRVRSDAIAHGNWADTAAGNADDYYAAGHLTWAAESYRRAADYCRKAADLHDRAATLPGGSHGDRDHAGWSRGDAATYDLAARNAEEERDALAAGHRAARVLRAELNT